MFTDIYEGDHLSESIISNIVNMKKHAKELTVLCCISQFPSLNPTVGVKYKAEAKHVYSMSQTLRGQVITLFFY